MSRSMRFVALRESRLAVAAARVGLFATAAAFIVSSIQSVLVISRYGVPFGTGLWTSAATAGLVSLLSGASALALAMGWRWSVWFWAISVAIVSATGVAAGLDPRILLRLEVLLPWFLLAACGALGLNQARPRRASGPAIDDV